MNPLFIAVFFLLSILILILFFSHIFFNLILDDKRKKGSLQWLFGSLYLDWTTKRIGFDLFNLRIWRGSLEKNELRKKKSDKSEKRKKPNFEVLWQEKNTLFKAAKIIITSIFDLFKKSKVEKFLLNVRIATPDPALTGVLYGDLSSISFPLSSFLPGSSIYFYPDFKTKSPNAKMEISLKARLFDIFWALVRAFFLLPKLALVKTFRKLFRKKEVK
jgi:hypothetical protein